MFGGHVCLCSGLTPGSVKRVQCLGDHLQDAGERTRDGWGCVKAGALSAVLWLQSLKSSALSVKVKYWSSGCHSVSDISS